MIDNLKSIQSNFLKLASFKKISEYAFTNAKQKWCHSFTLEKLSGWTIFLLFLNDPDLTYVETCKLDFGLTSDHHMPTWSLTAGPAKVQRFRCSQSLLYMSTSPSFKQSWIASLWCQTSFNRCTVDLLTKQINVCLPWLTRKECKQCEMLLIFGLQPWLWLWTDTNTVCNRLHVNLYTPLCKQWCTAVCKLSENQFSVVNIKTVRCLCKCDYQSNGLSKQQILIVNICGLCVRS